MKNKIFILIVSIFILVLSRSLAAQVASGGQYVLEEAVFSNGGGKSGGDSISISGAAGIFSSGQRMFGGVYTQQGGFNTNPETMPTGETGEIRGKVLISDAVGLKLATVTITGGTLTSPKTVLTNNFGYFRITDLEIGQIYTIRADHNKYTFVTGALEFVLTAEMEDLIFRVQTEN